MTRDEIIAMIREKYDPKPRGIGHGIEAGTMVLRISQTRSWRTRRLLTSAHYAS